MSKQAVDITTLLNKCPARAQVGDDQHRDQYDVDGCSLGFPGFPSTNLQNPTAFLLGRPTIANVSGTSTAFGVNQGRIDKSDIIPVACNVHDLCYQTCGSERATCDNQIADGMIAVCTKAYPSPDCPYTNLAERILKCSAYLTEQQTCIAAANDYAAAIKGNWLQGAQNAWNDDQVKHCDCCK
jgi:hypothetical protein